MAQQAKVPEAKPDDLNLNPGTHTMERKKGLLQAVLTTICVYTHTKRKLKYKTNNNRKTSNTPASALQKGKSRHNVFKFGLLLT